MKERAHVAQGTRAPLIDRSTVAADRFASKSLSGARPSTHSRARARALFLAVGLSILAFALGAPQASAERAYKTQLTGTPTGGGGSDVPFTHPWGLAVDGADNVWVSDVDAGFVDKFNLSNAFIAQGNGELNGNREWTGEYTRSVTFSDASEKLFVADSGHDDLWVARGDGSLEGDIKGEGATWGVGCCFIYAAADNSTGPTAGDVYVTSSAGTVTRIDSSGVAAPFSAVESYIAGSQITGTPEGPFEGLEGATIDSSGNLYVIETVKNVVDEFTSSGKFVQTFTGLTGTATAAAVDPTNKDLLVATVSGVVDEFSSAGTLIGELTGTATPAGSIGVPLGIAVNSVGEVYVSDGVNHVVDIFGPSGPPLSRLPLTVEKTGAGVGTVTSLPGGINCGATCSHEYAEGKTVKLTATPNAKSEFVGWTGGGCSGTGSCEVTLSKATTVKAAFLALPQQVLSVEVNDGAAGTVASSPGGIECGSVCSAEFNEGSTVTLIPTATVGFRFVGWSGCTAEAGENCEVELTASKAVKAEFEARPKFALNVNDEGTGKGTVTSAPGPINCEPEGAGICSAEVTETFTVVLSATPVVGSTFVKWSGCTSETEGKCEVTIAAETTVAADFSQTLPGVTTDATATVTATTAAVTGRVNPKGAISACKFVYGPTTAYGAEVPCEPGAVSGTTAQSVRATLPSLAPNTTYHYKLVATNSGGETGGTDSAFQTSREATALEDEVAAKVQQEAEAAASRIRKEAEDAASAAQSKLEGEAVAGRMQEMEAVLKRALDEEAAIRSQEEGHPAALKIVAVKVGAHGLTFRLGTAHKGSVRISGAGLKTTARTVAAGTHQFRVSLNSAGIRARKHGKKIKITVRITVGGKTTSLSRTVKL
jgi:hypothetical protein